MGEGGEGSEEGGGSPVAGGQGDLVGSLSVRFNGGEGNFVRHLAGGESDL